MSTSFICRPIKQYLEWFWHQYNKCALQKINTINNVVAKVSGSWGCGGHDYEVILRVSYKIHKLLTLHKGGVRLLILFSFLCCFWFVYRPMVSLFVDWPFLIASSRSVTFTDISSFFFVLLVFKFLLVSYFVCISRLSILVFSIVYMYCTHPYFSWHTKLKMFKV